MFAYGATQDNAIACVQALALRVVADRLEHDEADREFLILAETVLLLRRYLKVVARHCERQECTYTTVRLPRKP